MYQWGSDTIYRLRDNVDTINAILSNITYSPPGGWSGSETVSISLSDNGVQGYGGDKGKISSFEITVVPVDDPFTLTVSTFSISSCSNNALKSYESYVHRVMILTQLYALILCNGILPSFLPYIRLSSLSLFS